MIRQFFITVAACLILCSCPNCASHKAYPKNNADEIRWEQEYRDGKITWAEYRAKLDTEKGKKP